MSQEHGFRNLQRNLQVTGTAVVKDIDENVTEEDHGRWQVETVTNNGPTHSSGRENEIKNDSTAEYVWSRLPKTQIHTSVALPIEFTSLPSMADGRRSLKDIKTEVEVNAPTNIFDQLFRDYVKMLNVTTKTDNLEVEASDDECITVASSNAEIYEEVGYQDIETHEGDTQESVIKNGVNKCSASNPSEVAKEVPSSKKAQTLLSSDDSGMGNVICYICKKVLSHAYAVRQRMMSHSEEMYFSFPQEKEVSSPEVLQCSTMTQTLLSFDHSGEAKGVSSLFDRQAINDLGASSTFFNQKMATPTSPEISQCSTKIQTLLASNDSSVIVKEVPSSLSSSLNGVNTPGTSSLLSSHLDSLISSKLTPGAVAVVSDRCVSFTCNICKKRFETKDHFVSHSKVHTEEELRESIICNVCKTVFSHTTIVKQHMIVHSDSPEATSFDEEQQEHFSDHVYFGNVSFPEATEKLISVRDSVTVEQTQNLKRVQRLSTAHQKTDSPDRSEGVDLIMAAGSGIKNKSINGGSNGSKPVVINDEVSTPEATAGHLNFTTAQSNSGGKRKDLKNSCISIPPCMTKHQASFKRKQGHLSDIANNEIPVKYFSQLFKIDDNQHKGTCGHDYTATFDAERCDVGPSTGSAYEKTRNASKNFKSKAAESSDDECSSLASSNTDIYEDTDYQDIEIREEETQDASSEIGVNDLRTSVNVQLEVPSQTKSIKNNETEGNNIPHGLALSGGNCFDLLEQQDNSRQVEISTGSFSLDTSILPPSTFASSHPELYDETDDHDGEIHKSEARDAVTKAAANDLAASAKDFRFLSQTKLTKHETEVRNAHELILSSGDSPSMEQSQDNSSHVEISILPFSLQRNHLQAEPNRSTAPSSSAATSSSMNELVNNAIERSSDVLRNEMVSECEVSIERDSQLSNASESEPNQVDDNSLKSVKRKRIRDATAAAGVVFEDELSSPESSQCSRTVKLTHIQEAQYPCDQCGMQFRLQSSLCRHKSTHSKGSPFSATVSGVIDGTKLPPGSTLVSNGGYAMEGGGLSKHVTIHMAGKQYSCDQCNKSFRWRTGLHKHKKCTHSEEKRFPCNKCNKLFHFKSDLSRHNEYHNKAEHKKSNRGVCHIKNKEKPFACAFCGETFTERCAVDGHIRLRHDEKRYSCEFCGKRFVWDCDLSTHVRLHTQEKPYACDQCGQRFTLKSSLCRHRSTHSEERLFPCNKCNKSFKTRDGFLIHRKIHKKEELRKSAICNICWKVFTDASTLRLHMMSHGPGKKSEKEVLSTERSQQKEFIDSSIPAPSTFASSNTGIYYKTSGVAGIVCKDEVSPPESLQCSYTMKFSHMQEKPFTCDECGLQFRLECFLLRHKSAHSKGSPFSATVSGHIDATKLPPGSILVSERGVCNTKSKEKPFACAFCGKAYKRKQHVYGHIIQKHKEKRYSCEFCGKRYAMQSGLSAHVTVHTEEKPFTCDQCGMRFRLHSSLFSHHKYAHSEERLFSCNKCNKLFKTKESLARHSESHNKEDQGKGIVCDICKRKFRRPCNLRKHMMTHTGEKPFKCTLCDKQFRLRVQLRNHVNAHNGIKRLAKNPCSVCGKTVWESYMATHMRMHSGEKPYECNICFKRFPKKQNLEGHMRSHTGEKPFACSGCDKRFALYSNMVTHKAKCITLSENVA